MVHTVSQFSRRNTCQGLTSSIMIMIQNFSDDSIEVTEGVTLTPEIFGNKQKATSTPEIFGNKQFCPYLFRNKYNLR